jgi:hypothetical protein
VKDLEVMFTNVIVSSYENNATVSDGVVLIETFHQLAKRDAVKRCVERKASGTTIKNKTIRDELFPNTLCVILQIYVHFFLSKLTLFEQNSNNGAQIPLLGP